MKLLTVDEVAEGLKISESTVRRLIRSGLLPAYKVGERGQLRVKECDLDIYVESQRVNVGRADTPNTMKMESDK
jgi:excisionase family DNA binding protein